MRGRLLLLALWRYEYPESRHADSLFSAGNKHGRDSTVRRIKSFSQKINALLPDIQGQMKNICHLFSKRAIFGLFFENY